MIVNKIVLKKTVTSSDLDTSGDALTTTAYGEFLVKNIILKTDSTGLAGGTNLVIFTDNANGLANILVETVANLGANKTIDITTASVTKQPTVLEQGKKLKIKTTSAVGTGAGTMDVYMELEKLSANASILAA